MKETKICTLQLVLAVSRCYSSYTLFSDYILWSIILAFVSEYRLTNFDQLSFLSEIPQKLACDLLVLGLKRSSFAVTISIS